MANFIDVFRRFRGIEFSNPADVLHRNKKETGYTFYGIYQSAHPKWSGWSKIMGYLETHNYNLENASIASSQDMALIDLVKEFYFDMYWTPLRLREINSQKIAEEMFFFYINIGNKKKVVRYAQSIAGVVVDGVIGPKTIKALNELDVDKFDREYDRKEISHYKRLVRYNPKRFGIFLKGWINRARLI